MKQFWRTLLAIFAPLGSLARVLTAVLAWLCDLDAMLHDPGIRLAFQTLDGRRALEGNIARGEHWVNILIGARAAELLGLRYSARFDTDWSGWEPHVPRAFDALMQRHARMRASFATIERHARYRAARIRRALAADPLASMSMHTDAYPQSTRTLCIHVAARTREAPSHPCARAAVRFNARGPPCAGILPALS
jgi:hypothetical protein